MPAPPAPPDYRQHLEIETPEHVVLDYEIAGIGSRALAAIVDLACLAATLLGCQLVVLLLAAVGIRLGLSGAWAGVLVIGVSFLVLWGWFALFEGLRGGQTPGKRYAGIRVIRDTGHPVTFGAAAVRNLVRIADFALPPPYVLGALLVALHPRARRLGDIAAGTVVVRDRPIEGPLAAPASVPDTASTGALAAAELGDDEYRLLTRFQARSSTLAPAVRARLAAGLAARFAPRHPVRPSDDEEFLLALHAAETARRRGRLALPSRGSTGSTGGGLGERLAARQRERWTEFQALAERVARGGLDVLRAEELPGFAARYREIAADLARLRTYRADPALVAHVERLVAAGHNALYREPRRPWGAWWRAVALEFPAAVVGARAYVLAAVVAFAVPATVGYTLMREQPALAEELLPDVMLRRAEAGLARQAAGRRYVELAADERPLAASGIITNNIRVAILCFAGGIAAGVGSLVLLAFNGLQLGSAAGHFANLGLLGYLLEFIVGHGALELFAVCVAGAAGLLLGRALVAPGTLTRSDAVVLAGRRAVRMVGAAAVCLLVAGVIEGLVSTSGADLAHRAAAMLGSLVFLGGYLGAGLKGSAAWRSR